MVAPDSSQYAVSDTTLDLPQLNLASSMVVQGQNIQEGHDSDGDGDDDYIMALENEDLQEQGEQQSSDTLQTLSSSSVQPSTTVAVYETLSILSQNDSTQLSANEIQDVIEDAVRNSPKPHEPSQDSSISLNQDTAASKRAEGNEAHMQSLDTDMNDGDVNYQALLDNLSSSTAAAAATAPSAENIPSVTTSAPSDSAIAPRPSSVEPPTAALPIPAGLPPRPPPQEKPAIHPNYTPGEDIRSYHYPHTQTSTSHTSFASQPSNSYRPSQSYTHPASGATIGANGLPPPPLATFQQPPPKLNQVQRSPVTPQSRQRDGGGKNGEKSVVPGDEDEDEVPWAQELEKKYTEFLRDEAVYVTEGLWDRFPQGSRLFVGEMHNSIEPGIMSVLILIVGNLYTEKVTKRDLFYVFHKYGKLAQVSIKNAYGFIQYLDSQCCLRALQAEQGQSIRGRKLRE